MNGIRRNKQAFTLIELLVVVLIIGILAAVAVPQYQVAVAKARFMQLKVLVRAIYEAETVYHLANGDYSADFSQLDIEMPGGAKQVTASDITYEDFECSIKINDEGYGNRIFCKDTKHEDTPRIERYFKEQQFKCIFGTQKIAEKICEGLAGPNPTLDSVHGIYWFD